MLTVKYEWKDFFGNMEFRCDSTEYPTQELKKKAFTFFKKERNHGLDYDDYTFYFDTVSEFENGIITVRHYTGNGLSYDSEVKMSADKAKKFFYSL